MAYAIVGYFDSDTDLFIKALWEELADNNICDYMHNSENNPHIKFSMHTELDVEKASSSLSDLASHQIKFEVHLKNYGFFASDNPTVFINFSPSIQLIELEDSIRKTFRGYGDKFDFNYFDEGIWMPSCQLTVKKEHSEMLEAIKLLRKRPLQFNGWLERLGIIEFHPASQIVSYSLI